MYDTLKLSVSSLYNIGYAHPLSPAGAHYILVASSPLSLFSLTGLRMHAETKVEPGDEANILV